MTVTGADTPGITSALTGVAADCGASLLDIEQVVVQRRLILCLLLDVSSAAPRGEGVLKELLFRAKTLGLELHFEVLDPDVSSSPERGLGRYAVTAIGDRLDAGGVHKLGEVLARHHVNIESIRRLSDEPLTSVEVLVSFPDDANEALDPRAHRLRKDLMQVAAEADLDVALQRETLTRRSKRLVVMDMDSTLIQVEVIDELARLHGAGQKVAAITAEAMAGNLAFEESLRRRVAMLEGFSEEHLNQLAADLPLTQGAESLLRVLRILGYKIAVISGGFSFAANALKKRLGLDYAYANQLEVRAGKLTGSVLGPVVTPQRKADLLDAIAQREGIELEQTIAIGDGANDLLMLERAGLGIAFHAKPKLKAAAHTSLSAGGLDRILYLLGFGSRDIADLLGART